MLICEIVSPFNDFQQESGHFFCKGSVSKHQQAKPSLLRLLNSTVRVQEQSYTIDTQMGVMCSSKAFFTRTADLWAVVYCAPTL